MDGDHSCMVTIVLDARAFGHQIEALEHLVPERRASLVAWAVRLFRRYGVVDPAFDADDAVQIALLKVFQALKLGKIDLVESEEDLLKLLRHKLIQRVLSERRSEHTRKRGGSARPMGSRTRRFARLTGTWRRSTYHIRRRGAVSAEDQLSGCSRCWTVMVLACARWPP